MSEIVIVEDEVLISMSYKMILEQNGYQVSRKYRRATEVLKELNQVSPDLFILDIELIGEPNGIELAKKIRECKQTPILFATGNSVHDATLATQTIPGTALLSKPLNKEDLLRKIQELIENR